MRYLKKNKKHITCFFFSLFGIRWWQLWPVKQQSPYVTYLSMEGKVISHDEINRCGLHPGNRTSGQTSTSWEWTVQKLNQGQLKLHFWFNKAGGFFTLFSEPMHLLGVSKFLWGRYEVFAVLSYAIFCCVWMSTCSHANESWFGSLSVYWGMTQHGQTWTQVTPNNDYFSVGTESAPMFPSGKSWTGIYICMHCTDG